ncbi:MAG: 3-phosphoshikimate 1-carboxyvinyltransferase [Bacteroidota bacterium]|nr:3-phosphoshikimate 1-carboxyvinyltransferase [Bacteroidota bacterium]
MEKYFSKSNMIAGELELPGDKSISHRALIFSSMAKGTSRIENLSDAQDVISTMQCFKEMGVPFVKKGKILEVEGSGYKNFSKPANVLDAGNSGTTARLLTGLLACQDFDSVLAGDKSLSKRPMKRVADPLNAMGLNVKISDNSLPLTIGKSSNLHSVKYRLDAPSAQVKSAVLIAALHCKERSEIIDPFDTRDHTERMLNLVCEQSSEGKVIYASSLDYPKPQDYFIPSDISSAVFFIVFTLLSKDSSLTIKSVSLNPTRTKILDILINMGADIKILNETSANNEPYGDMQVKSSRLRNIAINKKDIPQIIDEIPILAIAGLFAEGYFEIRNAGELRYKESDRIRSICTNINKLGVSIQEYSDGFRIMNKSINNEHSFESFGDHRIAMAFAILCCLLNNGGKVNDFECVNISNPNFESQLMSIASV